MSFRVALFEHVEDKQRTLLYLCFIYRARTIEDGRLEVDSVMAVAYVYFTVSQLDTHRIPRQIVRLSNCI